MALVDIFGDRLDQEGDYHHSIEGGFMVNRGLIPTRCYFVVTGAYQDVKRRSFTANITDENTERFARTLDRSASISPISMSTVANEIIKPSVDIDRDINIDGGWAHPRLRFMMEFKQPLGHGSALRYCYNGYTNYVGADELGNIDPQMKLTVTSVTVIRETYRDRTGTDSRVMKDDNVLINYIHYESENGSDLSIGQIRRSMRRDAEYLLDPHAVVCYSLQRGDLLDKNLNGDTVYPGHSSLGNHSKRVRRSHNIPSHFLSHLSSVRKSSKYHHNDFDAEFSDVDVFGNPEDTRSLDLLRNTSVSEDPLFQLYEDETDINATATLQWGLLTEHYPLLEDDAVTSIVFPAALQEQTRSRTIQSIIDESSDMSMDTADWVGANFETIAATMISQQLPSLMMSELIRSMRFSVTNRVISTFDGDYAWIIGDERRRARDNRTAVFPLVDGLHPDFQRERLEALKLKIERILLDPLTNYGVVDVDIMIDCDVLSDCSIVISVDGGDEYRFSMPMFADSMASPLLTSSREHYETFSTDIIELVDDVLSI